MTENPLTLTFRGVRGSAPTPGPGTLRYGGHTTCLDLAFSPGHRLLIDCGSGLAALQSDLPPDPGPSGFRFDVFLTHYHQDHLEGLRFFRPFYDRRSRFTFHACPWQDMSVQQALEGSMRPPWFPVRWQDTDSQKRYVHLDGEPVSIDGVRITPASVLHPQGALAYRLDRGAHSIAFVTDSEPGDETTQRAVVELVRGADVLIHDAQYLPEEYESSYRNWGHSSWRHALELALSAGVRQLILFHHDPARTDDALDRLIDEARAEFRDTAAAREGMTLAL